VILGGLLGGARMSQLSAEAVELVFPLCARGAVPEEKVGRIFYVVCKNGADPHWHVRRLQVPQKRTRVAAVLLL